MRRGVLALALLVGIGTACGSTPKISVGRRPEAQPWNAQTVGRLALEIETIVAAAGRQDEGRIVEQVGTELEFGEEEVDPGALLGALEDLTYDAPTLVDLRVDSTEVAGAIRARQLRAPTLRHWKSRGCLGEGNQGKVVYVDCDAAREDPVLGDRLAFIVIKENRSRHTIYESLLNANAWPNSRLREVRAEFAQAIREVAEPVDLFQDGQGWAAKDPEAVREAEAERAAAAPRPERPRRPRENWEEAEELDVEVGSVPARVVPQQ